MLLLLQTVKTEKHVTFGNHKKRFNMGNSSIWLCNYHKVVVLGNRRNLDKIEPKHIKDLMISLLLGVAISTDHETVFFKCHCTERDINYAYNLI